MARLEISLLGSPKIKLNGQLLTGLPAKAQALLFFLVVTRQQQTRERLGEMLFSEETMSPEKKLANLRGPGALLALNRELSDFVESPKFSIAFKTESDYWLDVDEFQDCLRSSEPTPAQLQRAVNLYQGQFLTGLRLKEAEGFEEWAEQKRRALETQMTTALYLLTVHYKTQGQYIPAIAAITRLLDLNPYFEEANRELMLLLALTRQVNEACSHYERYEGLLAADGLEPEPDTTALYQKIWRGEITAVEAAILPTAPPQTWSPPFQAPPLLPHFVGRETLHEQIVAALQAEGSAHMQALVGMGGVGKSSLAGEIAHALQEYFVDGVLWATAAVSEPTAVLESWAQAYGYDFSRLTDLESRANAFRGVLADKRVLLVLDDVVSVSRIRPLLPNGPLCRVLITTRDQDLAHGLDAQVWRLAELSAVDGRRLLTFILGEERVNAEPAAATQICDLLQNLPLAVEIIGQRLRSRPRRQLADIVPRLRDEKQRLSELKISDRAVRASFAISHDTLDAQERQMFALMGLFHGRSFAADLMAGIAGHDRYETEDRIFALVALSLAQEDGTTRYRQHPLLADFAREKLGESGEEGVWYGRVADTYLTFAQQHQHDYDTLRPEWENLMAAMQAAYDYEQWQTVIDFADTLYGAWFARGRYTQAREGYQNACIAAHQLGKQDRWATLKLAWGRACIEQSDFDQAASHLADTLAFFRATNDEEGIANVYADLARIAMDRGQLQEAENLLQSCLEIRKKSGDSLGIATITESRARIAYRQNNYVQASVMAQEALALYERLDFRLGQLRTLGVVVNCLVEMRQDVPAELAAAEEYGLQAIALAEELQDTGEKAVAMYGLSRVQLKLGHTSFAREQAQQSLQLLERMGDRRTQASVLMHLSEIYFHEQDYATALQTAYAVSPMLQELATKTMEAINWWNIGHFHRLLNKVDQAKMAWSTSYQIAQEIEHTVLMDRLRPLLG